MSFVYRLDFPNGKSYVGITSTSVKRRFTAHAAPSCKTVVGKAIRKYGRKNVRIVTLHEHSDWEWICAMESAEILANNTFIPNGYNITYGGEGVIGHVHSAETRLKLSKATTRVMSDPKYRAMVAENTRRAFDDPALRALASTNASKQLHTAESNAKRSRTLTGRKASPATKLKLSIAAKKRGVSDACIQGRIAQAKASFNGVIKPCSNCGADLRVVHKRVRKNNYCNNKCRYPHIYVEDNT